VRAAAPRGTKRCKMSLEEKVVKEEQKDVDSYCDIDGLLETSDDGQEDYSDIDKLLESSCSDDEQELGVKGLQKVLYSTKKCEVRLKRLASSKLDMNNNKDDSDSDIEIESVIL
jgi:hypothetical protein